MTSAHEQLAKFFEIGIERWCEAAMGPPAKRMIRPTGAIIAVKPPPP
jgi:hypothetical protein